MRKRNNSQKLIKYLAIFIGIMLLFFLIDYTLDVRLGRDTLLQRNNRDTNNILLENNQNTVTTYPVGDTQKINSVAEILNINSTSDLFQLKLANGNTVNIKVTENTLVGNYWQEKDAEGNIKSSYDTVSMSELEKLFNGDKVMVTYQMRDENENYYEAEEFVIL